MCPNHALSRVLGPKKTLSGSIEELRPFWSWLWVGIIAAIHLRVTFNETVRLLYLIFDSTIKSKNSFSVFSGYTDVKVKNYNDFITRKSGGKYVFLGPCNHFYSPMTYLGLVTLQHHFLINSKLCEVSMTISQIFFYIPDIALNTIHKLLITLMSTLYITSETQLVLTCMAKLFEQS